METVQADQSNLANASKDKTTPAVTLKGSVFTLPILKLSSCDLDLIENELTLRLSTALEFFKNAPVVIDLELIQDDASGLRFTQLEALLRKANLVPVGIQNGSTEQNSAAVNAGFAILTGQSVDRIVENRKAESTRSEQTTQQAQQEDSAKQPGSSVFVTETSKFIKQPIRSGQRVYAKGGDLVILGMVNHGAEVMADGNIHIYAPLRGRALAGLDGNSESRIFCHSMEAELVAVAGNYRVFEEKVPDDLYKKSVQIYLDGEQLKIIPLD